MGLSGTRTTELLQLQETKQWRDKFLAALAGLLTAGPLGLVASIVVFERLKSSWIPWALIGVVAAPPLAYAQWTLITTSNPSKGGSPGGTASAALSISEADKAARACALALKNNSSSGGIRNPIDLSLIHI